MPSQSNPSLSLLADFMVHGGRLKAAMAAFPDAPAPWLDLSTGLNPVAYPLQPVSLSSLASLPDPDDLNTLIGVARKSYGAAANVDLIAVPGSDLAIALVPHLMKENVRVGIAAPTYLSHERAWRAGGHDVTRVAEIEDLAQYDVAILVNPNNPDGRVISIDACRRIAEQLDQIGGLLIVDEAFVEVCEQASLVPLVTQHPSLVVLRSFGKFYGLAGVRLGFVIGNHAIVERLREALGDWPVSASAIASGLQALSDRGWAKDTIARLASDVARLDKVLARAGCEPLGGTLLFRLVRHDAAQELFQHLARAGILVRPFDTAPDLLRIGLPADRFGLDRLAGTLNAFRCNAS